MRVDLVCLLHSLRDFSRFDEDHKINLIKLTQIELISDRNTLKLGYSDRVSHILNTILRKKDLNDLDFRFKPKHDVWVLSAKLTFNFKTSFFCFLFLL